MNHLPIYTDQIKNTLEQNNIRNGFSNKYLSEEKHAFLRAWLKWSASWVAWQKVRKEAEKFQDFPGSKINMGGSCKI